MNNILEIYAIIVGLVWFLLIISGTEPDDDLKEIDTFWDGVLYGIFWPLVFIKHSIKFIYKLIMR